MKHYINKEKSKQRKKGDKMKICIMLQLRKPAILHNIKFGEPDCVVWGGNKHNARQRIWFSNSVTFLLFR